MIKVITGYLLESHLDLDGVHGDEMHEQIQLTLHKNKDHYVKGFGKLGVKCDRSFKVTVTIEIEEK